MATVSALLCLVESASVTAWAQQGVNRSITFSGTAAATQVGSGYQYSLTGSGTLTGIAGSGAFSASGSIANLQGITGSSPLNGVATLIYPNGDGILARFSVPAGYFVPLLGQPAFNTASLTITGGSGALANASGTFNNLAVTTVLNSNSATLSATGSALLFTPALRNAGVLNFVGSMGHLASGAGWKTTITVVNSGTTVAQTQLRFYDDAGTALPLPLSFPQGGIAPTTLITYSQSIPPGSYLVIESQGTDAALLTGSAQLWTDGNVNAYIIFQFTSTGQEAAVPLQAVNAPVFAIPFDNTNGLATGVAIANVASQAGTVAVSVKDESGAAITSATLPLAALGHTSFVIGDRFSGAAGQRGVIEFTTPANGQISPIGIRASATGAFTTIPAIAIVR